MQNVIASEWQLLKSDFPVHKVKDICCYEDELGTKHKVRVQTIFRLEFEYKVQFFEGCEGVAKYVFF